MLFSFSNKGEFLIQLSFALILQREEYVCLYSHVKLNLNKGNYQSNWLCTPSKERTSVYEMPFFRDRR